MSVSELNRLHKRYIDVSDRFKSAWTFHQFLQGLHKILMDVEFGQHSADFQAVYGLLKEVSTNLNASTVERVKRELDMVERRLQELNRLMVQEDTKVSPSLLRLFFQRVRNFNESVIVQLVKFYLFHYHQVPWTQDYNDKVDFLVTKAAEEPTGPQGPWTLRKPAAIQQMVESFWKVVEGKELDDDVIATHKSQVDELRDEMMAVDSFEDLIDRKLVQNYREYKHGLGQLFYHPEIMTAIMATNIDLRNHIQLLYRREERSIIADYQRIFELEQNVHIDRQLDDELSDFREEVEKFEKNLQNESLSLEDLRRLRERVRHLVPRLTGNQDAEELFTEEPLAMAPVAKEGGDEGGDPGFVRPAGSGEWAHEAIASHHAGLIDALQDVGVDDDPRRTVLLPELFSFRLEPREVVAYQRLAESKNEELDDFILWAAALRTQIQEEVDEIQAILDDTAVTKDAPVFTKARETIKLGDRFVRITDHFLHLEVLDGHGPEAQALQVLKMRLVRCHAGLWLLVHRPSSRV